MSDRRLGEILISRGLLTNEQLRAALSEAALWGRRLGEVLVARGDCDAGQVLDALSSQLAIAVAPLAATGSIPSKVLGLLPADEARRRRLLPLCIDGRSGMLEVAMTDPSDLTTIEELTARTGYGIRPLLALGPDLDDAINRFYYGGVTPEPDTFRRLATPSRGMKRIAPRVASGRQATPPRGMPTAGTMTPPRGFRAVDVENSGPRARPVETPATGFEVSHARHSAARQLTFERTGSRPSLDDVGGRAPERRQADALAALHAEVDLLRRQLKRAYEVIRETSIAHRMLLRHLDAVPGFELDAYIEALKAELERSRRSR